MLESACVTGYGIVSPAGDGREVLWDQLRRGTPCVERHPTHGYAFHPIRNFDVSRYVAKRSDQRQIGPMMAYAIGAASQAIESLKKDPDAARDLEIWLAAGGGERDVETDEAIMRASLCPHENDGRLEGAQRALNAEWLKSLRPSHFLTQLPNMIAANIAIACGVSAPSRTLLGDEPAALEAVRQAVHRIQHGQAEMIAVGSAKNAECMHVVTSQTANGWMRHDARESVWDETASGYCIGSAGAFLLLESRRHAEARGARIYATIPAVIAACADRGDSTFCEDQLFGEWSKLGSRLPPLTGEALPVISGIPGDGAIARRERAFLSRITSAHSPVSARAPARMFGHSIEASFFTNLVIAVLCIEQELLFGALDPRQGLEQVAISAKPTSLLVTSWGMVAGEGFAVVEAPS